MPRTQHLRSLPSDRVPCHARPLSRSTEKKCLLFWDALLMISYDREGSIKFVAAEAQSWAHSDLYGKRNMRVGGRSKRRAGRFLSASLKGIVSASTPLPAGDEPLPGLPSYQSCLAMKMLLPFIGTPIAILGCVAICLWASGLEGLSADQLPGCKPAGTARPGLGQGPGPVPRADDGRADGGRPTGRPALPHA